MKNPTYISELTATIIATELTMKILYKLIMHGVTIDGPAQILGDNKSVATSCSIPFSTLKKEKVYIAYHRVMEAVAAGVIILSHIPVKYNQTDIPTNPFGPKKNYLLMKHLLV